MNRVLPTTLKGIGEALLYRNDIVEAVLKNDSLKQKLINKLMIVLKEECKHLCSVKMNSILRKCTPQQLLSFSMGSLISEWQREAPLLLQFLVTVASSSTHQIPFICMAGAILLRSRNIHMSALQHIVGLLLFHGNATKQVYTTASNRLFIPSLPKIVWSF